MPAQHVIIIGAGVAGLAVAQGLKKRNISFSVHERDSWLDSRRQGNRIKIIGDIKEALRGLFTPDVFRILEETCALTNLGETNLNATDGSILACRRGRLPPRIPPPLTADRALLRLALMTGISEHVHFNEEFVCYQEVPTDDKQMPKEVRASFRDGTTRIGTLLLGVDGSRSRVREQLIPGPTYIQDTKTCCVYGKTPLTPQLEERFPEIHRRWLTIVRDEAPLTQQIIFDDGPVVMVLEPCRFTNREVYNYLPQDYIHWGIMFRAGMLRLQKKDLDDMLHDGAELALQLTREWHPSIRVLVELQDASATTGIRIYSSPIKIPAWKTCGVVTILGDAAHSMSPAGGVGGVGALYDASKVVELVANERVSTDTIGRFEDAMRAFAGNLLQRTEAASQRMLGTGLVAQS